MSPQRALQISATVWADGETFFKEMAKTPKSKTWMVAPDAYLNIMGDGCRIDKKQQPSRQHSNMDEHNQFKKDSKLEKYL